MEFINVKLSDIGEVVGGATPSTKNPDNYDGNIVWITPKDLAGYNKVYISKGERNITEIGFKSCSTKILPKNSVLFSSRAPIGYVAISENDLCTNQGFKSIIPNNKIDYKFLYYLLKHNKNYIASKGSGSTFKEVSGSVMKEIELSIPKNIHDQKKISKILFDIDKKIELNNEINNNLYEMGDNLYNEYFGKYKDKLPSDYKIVKLNEVADNYDSKRKPMSSREREQHRGIYPYYGATSIIDYVDDYIFDDIYLLMGEDGTVKTNDGYPVLQYIWGKNWINNHAHVLKGKNISTELLMFALRKISVENIITGAVQPKINQENMNKIEFVIGSDSKNKELEDILKKLMDKSKNIIEENKKLEQLRDTLLPKLMNGEIDLDNIEI